MDISRRAVLFNSLIVAGCSTQSTFSSDSVKPNTMKGEKTSSFFELYPVGRIKRKGKSVRLHIFEKYTNALKGLDGFSHVFVLYWFDRNDTREKRSILQVHPRGNKRNPLTGVFACRAPVRPNLIALSLCKIISVKDGIVHIDNIDALNNSPVLDIKPYIPHIDHITKDVRVPDWL
jgi:tRNA-Thr(GGU) m(6)t(6)A37 methyltransferase TsaA